MADCYRCNGTGLVACDRNGYPVPLGDDREDHRHTCAKCGGSGEGDG